MTPATGAAPALAPGRREAGPVRVALLCSGLGRVHRGFEAFTEGLFERLAQRRGDVEVTLFCGAGPDGPRRRALRHLHRGLAPVRALGARRALLLEKRSFALRVYPRLRAGRFDVVHYNEVNVGSALFHLRRALGGGFRLLYCDGGPAPPGWYRDRCDVAQVLTAPAREEALAAGVDPARVVELPYGVDATRFRPRGGAARRAVRAELGVPEAAPLVASVAALDRAHKRIDYVIEEVARVPGRPWLVVAGERGPDAPGLAALARERLGERWCFVTWPRERIPDLLGAADAFVLASLHEGLGLALVEAMLCAVPVVAHDGAVQRWVVGEAPARLRDLRLRGALAGALVESLAEPRPAAAREVVRRRFDWSVLAARYLEAYRAVRSAPVHA